MFHADGEVAVARAAQAKKTLQILSTVTTHSVEDVIKARGGPVWYQLYAVSNWALTEKVVKRAEDAGCPVVAWTIDLAGRPEHGDCIAFSPRRFATMRRLPRRALRRHQ